MNRLLALSSNTFREAIRDRILYSLLFFAALVLLGSLAMEQISLGDREKVVRSFAFGAIRFFGILIALFLGVSLVHKELERKTIYTIASKPIHRGTFLVGKYLGLMAVLALEVLIMAVLYLGLTGLTQGMPTLPFWTAILMLMLELSLLVAWCMLFSAYSSPTVATFFSIAVLVIGNVADDIWTFGQQSESEAVQSASEVLYWLLPNFQVLNGSDLAVHNSAMGPEQFFASLCYGVGYTVAVMSLAVMVFSKKDFK
jgi:ABC-type transport system involved in multi-copper enzyme maturation permease subunit